MSENWFKIKSVELQSTANAVSSGKGLATSDSIARNGSSSAASVASGRGDSKANSVGGDKHGKSKALAQSQGNFI